MSQGTNKERLIQNNAKLEELIELVKTKGMPSVGGGNSDGWQPNADMVWAKEVCENDVGPTECKVLQMINNLDVTSTFYISKNGYAKTSDGRFYEGSPQGTLSVTHTWDDTNARISEGFKDIYEKVRWVILYYPENSFYLPSSWALKNVIYVCFNNVSPVYDSTRKLFKGSAFLEYVDCINNAIINFGDSTFQGCRSLKVLPNSMATGEPAKAYCVLNYCASLEKITKLDFKNSKDFNNAFAYCYNLKTLTDIDLRNATNLNYIVDGCSTLLNLYLKNIPKSITISSSTVYGHLLTLDSLLNTIKELWDNSAETNTKTLTVGSSNLPKLANVYVKLVDITDEMRAEDEFIDKKFPFEVCESTDEGAMLITEYVTSKNWQIK